MGATSFATWVGRVDDTWRQRHDIIETSEHPPPHHVGRFYSESVVFDRRSGSWWTTVEVNHVLVGSDYPYPSDEMPARGMVRSAPSLDAASRDQV